MLGGEGSGCGHGHQLAAAETLAREVTLVHRRDALKADPSQLATLQALRDQGAVRFVASQPTGFDADRPSQRTAPHQRQSRRAGPALRRHRQPASASAPKLGPIADWGLQLEHKLLVVGPAALETSEPGIFAVGDVNIYPGKRKLLVCGFPRSHARGLCGGGDRLPRQAHLAAVTDDEPRLRGLAGVVPARNG